MHRELEELWMDAIELKADEQVVTYLRNHHKEYQEISERQKKLVEQYPVLLELLEGDGCVTLNEAEHRAIKVFLNEQADLDRLEKEYHYYYGQSHVFSYGRILKQLQKEINQVDQVAMKYRLVDLLTENRMSDAELDFLKTDPEYQKRRQESLRQERILKNMKVSEEVMAQMDKVAGSIHDHWSRYGELIYQYALRDILEFLIER